jgi:hypothetical protein
VLNSRSIWYSAILFYVSGPLVKVKCAAGSIVTDYMEVQIFGGNSQNYWVLDFVHRQVF